MYFTKNVEKVTEQMNA